jgi:hypothetical protein
MAGVAYEVANLREQPEGIPPCHEHACVRCPTLRISATMLERLAELEDGLLVPPCAC